MQRILALVLLVIAACPVWAQQPVPQPPELGVRGYILADFNSGTILAQQNATERLEPASITKLMSAYVIYARLREGAISTDDLVTVSEKAWRMEGSRMFIEVGKQVTVHNLLRGMVIQSGNDATVALAEYIAGSEEGFVTLMNQAAQRLGLTQSHFTNASGLPHPEHYTTARDIALLTRALIAEFPDHYALYSEPEFTFNNITQRNRNPLLGKDPSVDGVKTGHTNAAGYCLVTSAVRGESRLISVVLGADSDSHRADASQRLLNYGFQFFETHKLYSANQALTQARVWKGEAEEAPLGLTRDLYVTVARGQYASLAPSMELDGPLQAPLAAGQPVGRVIVSLGSDVVAQAPLVALADVAPAGFFGRAWDSVKMTVSGWFD